MATGIILQQSDAHGNNQSGCFIRVSRYDCCNRVISVLIFIHNHWWPSSGYASWGNFSEL